MSTPSLLWRLLWPVARLLWLLLLWPVLLLLWHVYDWPGMRAGLVVCGVILLWGSPATPHVLAVSLIWLVVAVSLRRW